jgi:hypothetical protein
MRIDLVLVMSAWSGCRNGSLMPSDSPAAISNASSHIAADSAICAEHYPVPLKQANSRLPATRGVAAILTEAVFGSHDLSPAGPRRPQRRSSKLQEIYDAGTIY